MVLLETNMNQKTLIFSAALVWVGSVAFAYLVGKSSDPKATAVVESSTGQRSSGTGKLSALGGGAVDQGSDSESKSGRRAKSDTDASSALSILQAAMNSDNPVERMSGFMQAIAMMSVDEFASALDAMKDDLKRGENQREVGLLLYAWAEKDGAAALEYLDELNLGREGYSLYGSALSAWGANDPGAATAWAMAKHEGKEGNDNWYMVGVIGGVVQSDPVHAAELAQGIGFGRARGQALETVVEEMTRQGGDVARNWVESLGNEDERFRAGAARMVAGELAREDPQAAADWVMGLEMADKEQAVATVASEWVRRAPDEAAAWVAGIEDPQLRSQGIESVVESWTSRDVNAVGTWLGQLPASPEMDGPVRTYAMMVRERDPGGAIIWANTITNEEVRGEVVGRIGGEWLRSNPDEARVFLQQQESLPSALLERMN